MTGQPEKALPMTLSPQPTRGGLPPFLRWLVFCLVFFGLPGVLVWQIWDRTARELLAQAAAQAGLQLSAEITHLQPIYGDAGQNNLLFSHIQWRVFRDPILRAPPWWSASGPVDPAGTLARIKRRLQRRLPGLVSFVLLDHKGRVVPGVSETPAGLDPLWQTFWEDYRHTQGRDQANIKKPPETYRPLFGSLFGRETVARLQDRLVSTSYRTHGARIMFSRAYPQGMLCSFFHQKPGWQGPLFRIILDLNPSGKKDLRIGFVDRRRDPARWFPAGPARAGLPAALLALEGSTEPVVSREGFWWSQAILDPHCRLVAALPDRTTPGLQATGLRLARGLLLLGGLLAGLTWTISEGGRSLPLGIRQKLWFLLAWLTGIPLMLLGLSAHGFLAEYRYLLEQETRVSRECTLRELDRRFLDHLGTIERVVRRTLQGNHLGAPGNLPALRRRMDVLDRRFRPSFCQLVDAQGRDQIDRQVPWAWQDPYVPRIIQQQVTMLFDLFNPKGTAGGRSSGAAQMMAATAEMYGLNPELLRGQFRQSINHLAEIRLAAANLRAILVPIHHGADVPLVAVLGWESEGLEAAFAGEFFAAHPSQPGQEELVIYTSKPGYQPASPRWRSLLDHLRRWLDNSHEPIHFQVVDGREALQGTALAGSYLGKSFLYILQPASQFTARIAGRLGPILVVTLLILATTAGVGLFLGRHFLGPIDALREGIAALQARSFKVRLPVTGKDELADLTTAFNRMMEGMAELELAGLIQDNLFPDKPLVWQGWQVAGSCTPAARVGGDYFDFFPLDDRHLGLVVGDVSGHGVGAALVVAMAKALVSFPGRRFTPGGTLDLTHAFFRSHLGQCKLMTCWFGVVDTASGTLTYANAGHCYPLLVQNKASCHLAAPGYPLGVRTRRKNTETTVPLPAGSTLLLYSDGVIEAATPAGGMVGYDGLAAAAVQHVRPGAPATLAALTAWFGAVTGGLPPADDVTLVVVQAPVGCPGDR
ncbi:MAG: SpoIIE family protein phosphatase [Candidatus Riflebacteria bacterium]|nr:SpoIIE family protein phosphatase [Candidatus Riflebacteria bacterium]